MRKAGGMACSPRRAYKRSHHTEDLTMSKIDINSAFGTAVLEQIRRTNYDEKFSDRYWRIEQIESVQNIRLKGHYDAFKNELKTLGRKVEDIDDVFVFSVETEKACKEICKEGHKVGLKRRHVLGYTGSGVHLVRNFDILSRYIAYQQYTSPVYVMIYKAFLGKSKPIVPRLHKEDTYVTPWCGFDCHISARKIEPEMHICEALNCSYVYFFEYDDISSNTVKYPRQILPHAVVQLSRKYTIGTEIPFLAVRKQDKYSHVEVKGETRRGFRFTYPQSKRKIKQHTIRPRDTRELIKTSLQEQLLEMRTKGESRMILPALQKSDLNIVETAVNSKSKPQTSPQTLPTSETLNITFKGRRYCISPPRKGPQFKVLQSKDAVSSVRQENFGQNGKDRNRKSFRSIPLMMKPYVSLKRLRMDSMSKVKYKLDNCQRKGGTVNSRGEFTKTDQEGIANSSTVKLVRDVDSLTVSAPCTYTTRALADTTNSEFDTNIAPGCKRSELEPVNSNSNVCVSVEASENLDNGSEHKVQSINTIELLSMVKEMRYSASMSFIDHAQNREKMNKTQNVEANNQQRRPDDYQTLNGKKTVMDINREKMEIHSLSQPVGTNTPEIVLAQDRKSEANKVHWKRKMSGMKDSDLLMPKKSSELNELKNSVLINHTYTSEKRVGDGHTTRTNIVTTATPNSTDVHSNMHFKPANVTSFKHHREQQFKEKKNENAHRLEDTTNKKELMIDCEKRNSFGSTMLKCLDPEKPSSSYKHTVSPLSKKKYECDKMHRTKEIITTETVTITNKTCIPIQSTQNNTNTSVSSQPSSSLPLFALSPSFIEHHPVPCSNSHTGTTANDGVERRILVGGLQPVGDNAKRSEKGHRPTTIKDLFQEPLRNQLMKNIQLNDELKNDVPFCIELNSTNPSILNKTSSPPAGVVAPAQLDCSPKVASANLSASNMFYNQPHNLTSSIVSPQAHDPALFARTNKPSCDQQKLPVWTKINYDGRILHSDSFSRVQKSSMNEQSRDFNKDGVTKTNDASSLKVHNKLDVIKSDTSGKSGNNLSLPANFGKAYNPYISQESRISQENSATGTVHQGPYQSQLLAIAHVQNQIEANANKGNIAPGISQTSQNTSTRPNANSKGLFLPTREMVTSCFSGNGKVCHRDPRIVKKLEAERKEKSSVEKHFKDKEVTIRNEIHTKKEKVCNRDSRSVGYLPDEKKRNDTNQNVCKGTVKRNEIIIQKDNHTANEIHREKRKTEAIYTENEKHNLNDIQKEKEKQKSIHTVKESHTVNEGHKDNTKQKESHTEKEQNFTNKIQTIEKEKQIHADKEKPIEMYTVKENHSVNKTETNTDKEKHAKEKHVNLKEIYLEKEKQSTMHPFKEKHPESHKHSNKQKYFGSEKEKHTVNEIYKDKGKQRVNPTEQKKQNEIDSEKKRRKGGHHSEKQKEILTEKEKYTLTETHKEAESQIENKNTFELDSRSSFIPEENIERLTTTKSSSGKTEKCLYREVISKSPETPNEKSVSAVGSNTSINVQTAEKLQRVLRKHISEVNKNAKITLTCQPTSTLQTISQRSGNKQTKQDTVWLIPTTAPKRIEQECKRTSSTAKDVEFPGQSMDNGKVVTGTDNESKICTVASVTHTRKEIQNQAERSSNTKVSFDQFDNDSQDTVIGGIESSPMRLEILNENLQVILQEKMKESSPELCEEAKCDSISIEPDTPDTFDEESQVRKNNNAEECQESDIAVSKQCSGGLFRKTCEVYEASNTTNEISNTTEENEQGQGLDLKNEMQNDQTIASGETTRLECDFDSVGIVSSIHTKEEPMPGDENTTIELEEKKHESLGDQLKDSILNQENNSIEMKENKDRHDNDPLNISQSHCSKFFNRIHKIRNSNDVESGNKSPKLCRSAVIGTLQELSHVLHVLKTECLFDEHTCSSKVENCTGIGKIPWTDSNQIDPPIQITSKCTITDDCFHKMSDDSSINRVDNSINEVILPSQIKLEPEAHLVSQEESISLYKPTDTNVLSRECTVPNITIKEEPLDESRDEPRMSQSGDIVTSSRNSTDIGPIIHSVSSCSSLFNDRLQPHTIGSANNPIKYPLTGIPAEVPSGLELKERTCLPDAEQGRVLTDMMPLTSHTSDKANTHIKSRTLGTGDCHVQEKLNASLILKEKEQTNQYPLLYKTVSRIKANAKPGTVYREKAGLLNKGIKDRKNMFDTKLSIQRMRAKLSNPLLKQKKLEINNTNNSFDRNDTIVRQTNSGHMDTAIETMNQSAIFPETVSQCHNDVTTRKVTNETTGKQNLTDSVIECNPSAQNVIAKPRLSKGRGDNSNNKNEESKIKEKYSSADKKKSHSSPAKRSEDRQKHGNKEMDVAKKRDIIPFSTVMQKKKEQFIKFKRGLTDNKFIDFNELKHELREKDHSNLREYPSARPDMFSFRRFGFGKSRPNYLRKYSLNQKPPFAYNLTNNLACPGSRRKPEISERGTKLYDDSQDSDEKEIDEQTVNSKGSNENNWIDDETPSNKVLRSNEKDQLTSSQNDLQTEESTSPVSTASTENTECQRAKDGRKFPARPTFRNASYNDFQAFGTKPLQPRTPIFLKHKQGPHYAVGTFRKFPHNQYNTGYFSWRRKYQAPIKGFQHEKLYVTRKGVVQTEEEHMEWKMFKERERIRMQIEKAVKDFRRTFENTNDDFVGDSKVSKYLQSLSGKLEHLQDKRNRLTLAPEDNSNEHSKNEEELVPNKAKENLIESKRLVSVDNLRDQFETPYTANQQRQQENTLVNALWKEPEEKTKPTDLIEKMLREHVNKHFENVTERLKIELMEKLASEKSLVYNMEDGSAAHDKNKYKRDAISKIVEKQLETLRKSQEQIDNEKPEYQRSTSPETLNCRESSLRSKSRSCNSGRSFSPNSKSPEPPHLSSEKRYRSRHSRSRSRSYERYRPRYSPQRHYRHSRKNYKSYRSRSRSRSRSISPRRFAYHYSDYYDSEKRYRRDSYTRHSSSSYSRSRSRSVERSWERSRSPEPRYWVKPRKADEERSHDGYSSFKRNNRSDSRSPERFIQRKSRTDMYDPKDKFDWRYSRNRTSVKEKSSDIPVGRQVQDDEGVTFDKYYNMAVKSKWDDTCDNETTYEANEGNRSDRISDTGKRGNSDSANENIENKKKEQKQNKRCYVDIEIDPIVSSDEETTRMTNPFKKSYSSDSKVVDERDYHSKDRPSSYRKHYDKPYTPYDRRRYSGVYDKQRPSSSFYRGRSDRGSFRGRYRQSYNNYDERRKITNPPKYYGKWKSTRSPRRYDYEEDEDYLNKEKQYDDKDTTKYDERNTHSVERDREPSVEILPCPSLKTIQRSYSHSQQGSDSDNQSQSPRPIPTICRR